jgi:hypothetical protein
VKPEWTVWVIVAWVVALVVYNLGAAGMAPGGTVSETLSRASRLYPIVPFMVGVLGGHWFAPRYGWTVAIHEWACAHPFEVLLLGVVVGGLLWLIRS